MRYPRSLPDTSEAKAWWEGAYAYFKEHGTKKGYPPLELPNGDKIDLHYSSNASKVDVEKGTGLKLRPKSQQSKDTKVRKASLKQQTYGDTKLADTPTPTGYNDHHVRPRGVYQQFFEGLDDADSKELARYAEQDLLMPLGDHPANNARIPDAVHDAHHSFARSNPGLERGLTDRIQGMDLNQRKQALKLFKENIQPALDEDLYSRMTKHSSKLVQLERFKSLKKLGKASNVPLLGGAIAGGATLLSGGSPAEAATAVLDAENPLDGGALGYGDMNEPQRVAQRQQQLEYERSWMTEVLANVGSAMRHLRFSL